MTSQLPWDQFAVETVDELPYKPPVPAQPPVSQPEPVPVPSSTPVPAPPVTATKSWIALVGGLLATFLPIIVQVSGFLPAPWPAAIAGFVSIVTAFGVYKVPNKMLATTATNGN